MSSGLWRSELRQCELFHRAYNLAQCFKWQKYGHTAKHLPIASAMRLLCRLCSYWQWLQAQRGKSNSNMCSLQWEALGLDSQLPRAKKAAREHIRSTPIDHADINVNLSAFNLKLARSEQEEIAQCSLSHKLFHESLHLFHHPRRPRLQENQRARL